MIAVEAVGAAERQADAMHRQRIGLAQAFERGDRGGIAHVVLGMDFEPAGGRAPGQHFGDVWRAKTDARGFRDREGGKRVRHRSAPWFRVVFGSGSGLGFGAAAGELGAGAGGHVDPGIALVVGGRRAGAGMRRGLAVVLAGLDDAVALLERVFGLGGRAGKGGGAEPSVVAAASAEPIRDLVLIMIASPGVAFAVETAFWPV